MKALAIGQIEERIVMCILKNITITLRGIVTIIGMEMVHIITILIESMAIITGDIMSIGITDTQEFPS
jgi:hypothetical protein